MLTHVWWYPYEYTGNDHDSGSNAPHNLSRMEDMFTKLRENVGTPRRLQWYFCLSTASDVSPWPWPCDSSHSPWPWPRLCRSPRCYYAIHLHHRRRHENHCFTWDSVPADVEDSRRLEKIPTHYMHTINSVSFDSDTKLADICSQMEFVPLWYLLERILAVRASSAPVERVFTNSGLIVHPHRAKMSDKSLESLVFAKCSIISWLLCVHVCVCVWLCMQSLL